MIYFQKLIVVFLFVTGTVRAGEGTIEITGMGQANRAPEYAEIRVNVTSICYDKSLDAKDANAVLANHILTVLNKFVRSERDKVSATGGQNVRQSEVFYFPAGGSKTLCELKWRATNTLTLQTASMRDIPEIQDLVLAASDKLEGLDPKKAEQTYGELMQANFFAYPETMTLLKKESQKRAWDDAKAQLAVFKEQCNFKTIQLKSIAEPGYSLYPKVTDRLYVKESSETPIIPDKIFLSAVWRFVWTFVQSGNCLL